MIHIEDVLSRDCECPFALGSEAMEKESQVFFTAGKGEKKSRVKRGRGASEAETPPIAVD